ncbi:MAG: MFS transporter [Marinicaulis sp.]|nr:MFS transporter [Marinicaulis sp.]
MNPTLKSLRQSLFLISMPMVFIMFGLPLRAEDLGASGIEIGALFAIFTASLLVIRPLVGIGLDLIGRRIFFIAAMAAYLAANALYAFADTLPGLFFARAFHGLGFSFLLITADTITADVTARENRSEAMGGNIASQSRGGMIGAFVGFSLVGAMPGIAWQYSFAVFAAAAFAALIFSIRNIPETRAPREKSAKRQKFNFPSRYYRLLFVIFLGALASAIIQPYYLIYLRGKLGLEVNALAAVFIPVGIAYAVLPGILGKMTGRFNRPAVITAGLLIAAMLYLAVPFIDGFFVLIAAFTAAAIGSVLYDLTKNAWIGDIGGDETSGRNFGLAAFAAGLGATLGPLIGGYVFDGFGREFVFYAGALVFLIAMLLTLPYIYDHRSQAN